MKLQLLRPVRELRIGNVVVSGKTHWDCVSLPGFGDRPFLGLLPANRGDQPAETRYFQVGREDLVVVLLDPRAEER